jgi:AhpD family alkylhydroperoxidase
MASNAIPMHRAPRLAPLTKLPGLWLRLFAALFRRQLGKVMTPVWVIYARMPRLLWPQVLLVRLAQKGLSLEPELVDLVQIRHSVAQGCSFCVDLHRAFALRTGRSRAKVDAASASGSVLSGLRPSDASPALTSRERLAMALADEMAGGGTPSDATFEGLRTAFDERQIVELVWLSAFSGYLTAMARALGIGSDGFCELLPPSARGEDRDVPATSEARS